MKRLKVTTYSGSTRLRSGRSFWADARLACCQDITAAAGISQLSQIRHAWLVIDAINHSSAPRRPAASPGFHLQAAGRLRHTVNNR